LPRNQRSRSSPRGLGGFFAVLRSGFPSQFSA
jgi:hypothetical protein